MTNKNINQTFYCSDYESQSEYYDDEEYFSDSKSLQYKEDNYSNDDFYGNIGSETITQKSEIVVSTHFEAPVPFNFCSNSSQFETILELHDYLNTESKNFEKKLEEKREEEKREVFLFEKNKKLKEEKETEEELKLFMSKLPKFSEGFLKKQELKMKEELDKIKQQKTQNIFKCKRSGGRRKISKGVAIKEEVLLARRRAARQRRKQEKLKQESEQKFFVPEKKSEQVIDFITDESENEDEKKEEKEEISKITAIIFETSTEEKSKISSFEEARLKKQNEKEEKKDEDDWEVVKVNKKQKQKNVIVFSRKTYIEEKREQKIKNLKIRKLCVSLKKNTKCANGLNCRFAHCFEELDTNICKFGKNCGKVIRVHNLVYNKKKYEESPCIAIHNYESKDNYMMRLTGKMDDYIKITNPIKKKPVVKVVEQKKPVVKVVEQKKPVLKVVEQKKPVNQIVSEKTIILDQIVMKPIVDSKNIWSKDKNSLSYILKNGFPSIVPLKPAPWYKPSQTLKINKTIEHNISVPLKPAPWYNQKTSNKKVVNKIPTKIKLYIPVNLNELQKLQLKWEYENCYHIYLSRIQ